MRWRASQNATKEKTFISSIIIKLEARRAFLRSEKLLPCGTDVAWEPVVRIKDGVNVLAKFGTASTALMLNTKIMNPVPPRLGVKILQYWVIRRSIWIDTKTAGCSSRRSTV